MGTFSDFLENELLDHVFGNAAYTAPATLYLAAFTVAPNDAGTGGTECTGGSYARLAVTNNATNFPAASGGAKSNGVAFEFIEATAGWGTVVFIGVYDAVSGGNFLGGGTLAVSQTVNTGNILRVKIGDMDLTLG